MSETETKEDFCPACVILPVAMAGAGMASVGATKQNKSNKKKKKLMFWVGITTTLFALIIGLIYLKRCKNCR
uniref:Transmembrane protein n=1 Tax=viral metagenome TaxID=1070528 RepID=A0A6C0H2S6_9ZZZZ